MGYILIKNGAAVTDGKIEYKNILINGSKIEDSDFKGEIPFDCKVIDAAQQYVSAGFIDLHLHGGGGYDFMDCTPESLKEISKIHLINGTTAMLPTAVSSSFQNIINFIDAYKKVVNECPNFYGIHLEGPFISKDQKGAHKEKYLHSPTKEEVDILIDKGRGVIKRVTAAPEIPDMEYFNEKMLDNGVILSLGHSNATAAEASKAFSDGYSLITHFFSATTKVRKIGQDIIAGIEEATLLNDDINIELILDGKHTAPEAVQLVFKIKGADKISLITDALRPAGTNVKESYLGAKIPENRVIVEDGVAKLPDRSSYAGSIATTNTLLERAVNFYGFNIADAVKMLTETPAKIIGFKDRGIIKNGYKADIVIFNKNLKVTKVIIGGNIVN